jgi:medium-chain acyl-[acyl-carrier-protein] hydrolase
VTVLTVPPAAGARVRLLCLPFAGGGSVLFSGWAAKLPAGVQVCPVRPAGRESRLRVPPPPSIPALVAEIADALAGHDDLPLVAYGHSMGALVGFELARELRRRRRPTLDHLFVAACRPPHCRQVDVALSQLPEPELLAAIETSYGALDPELREFPDVLRLLLPALRADLAAVERYRFVDEPPLACDLTVFGAAEDRSVNLATLAEWRRHVTGSVVTRSVAGGHRFVAAGGDEPLNTLAAALRERLRWHAAAALAPSARLT